MYNVPRSMTPERFYLSCLYRRIKCSFLLCVRHQPSRFTNIMELNPFNHLAFGPLPNCLRLKAKVTFCPPRLATSEWLVLTRRESHPLYDTTYARPHTQPVSRIRKKPPIWKLRSLTLAPEFKKKSLKLEI